MLTTPRDRSTIDRLQRLLDKLFGTRDEFYVAAEALSDADQRHILHWFGDRLGGHAADLQQIIAAGGAHPVAPRSQSKTAERLTSIQSRAGDHGVLDAAEKMEQGLAAQYDQAIEQLEDQEVVSLLGKQREESEFADSVLRGLKKSAK